MTESSDDEDTVVTRVGDIIEHVWAHYGGDEWIDVAAAKVVAYLREVESSDQGDTDEA